MASSASAESKERANNTFPLESGHRGDAYFGRTQAIALSTIFLSQIVLCSSWSLPLTSFLFFLMLEHDTQGDHHSSSSHPTGPIYSPPSSTVNTSQQRNFPLEARHRGDAYYGRKVVL